MGFNVAVTTVLTTLLFIIPGFIACKIKKVKAEHQYSLSGLLIYVCSPCLVFSTITEIEFSRENILNMVEFFIATFILQAAFMLILYFIFRRKYEDARYRMLTIGGVLGNVGFFGLPVIRTLLPDNPEVACYAAVFMISMNIFVFTIAVFCLTQNRKYVALKPAILNPSTLSFIVSIIFYALQIPLPGLVTGVISTIGKITTPMCMMILGIRLASVPDLKKIFIRPFVYAICLTKLLIFPIFAYALISLLPVPFAFKCTILILCGTPDAAVLLSMAEMYESEQELAANCVLISTLMCVITIPLLTLLVR